MKSGETSKFEEIKKRAEGIKASNKSLDEMQTEIEAMYWLTDSSAKGQTGRDAKDIKLTIDPSPQNKVDGMVRLISTSEPIFRVTNAGDQGDFLEGKFASMWKTSNASKRAKLEKDMARAAVLHGRCDLLIKSVAALKEVKGLNDVQLARLERISENTSYLFEAVTPRAAYPIMGDYGMDAYLRTYKTTVAEFSSRWGDDGKLATNGLKENDAITINDWYDTVFRLVWLEGGDKPAYLAEHGLIDIPVVCKYADGSDLFEDADKKVKPFLYGVWKSEMWKRKNLVWTAIMTSMFERGTGVLLAIEGVNDDAPPIKVNMQGAVRTIEVPEGGAVRQVDDKAFDPQMMQMLGQLDQLITESTIYNQTLGQPIGGNAAFSTVALLNQAGRLPLVDAQDAVSNCIREAMEVSTRWIKKENPNPAFMSASDLPEKFDLEVRLEVKLPQDMVRSAQTAMQLRGFVPDEWLYQNLMQITDVRNTKKSLVAEKVTAALVGSKIQQLIAAANQPPEPPEPPEPSEGEMIPPDQEPAGASVQPPEGMIPGQGGEPMAQTEAGIPGGNPGMMPGGE